MRPTVAVSVYIVFAAHALARHPECRSRLLADPGYAELFAQEVRRDYPFSHNEINHRCPGEGVSVALMTSSLGFLCAGLGYELPPQDLDIDWTRLPALPRSRFVMSDIVLRDAGSSAS